jgi:hypothetical protein|uniref:Uncharacterized protein n=1 Tax=Picea sitchensis TaxID=3332 RepID=A0A6B9XRZ5_PICSI|nr:hypothetical protein Q903MT_gene6760 [Picea sitchensis]
MGVDSRNPVKLASDPDQMALSLLRLGLLLPPLSYRPLLLVRVAN